MDNVVGTTIDGKFRVTGMLGSGGLGTVYRAEQDELSRSVAIKVLHSSGIDDEENRIRFEREARILGSIEHENVVAIYSFGLLPDRKPYMAMEYVEGTTLGEALEKKGALDWRKTVKIARQICSAMAAVHKSGIIHRDLKPQNIMLVGTQDKVKVLDFGLSKLAPEAASMVQKLTQTGALVGSVHYMSPEVCSGRPATASSDIYSLGCVLYECLAGKPPFEYDNPIGILGKHCLEMPAPLAVSKKDKSFPAELELVVFKALQKEPQDRFADMIEFEQALTAVEQGNSSGINLTNIKISRSRASNAQWLLGASAFVGVLSVVVVGGLLSKRTSAISDRATLKKEMKGPNVPAKITKAQDLLHEAQLAGKAGNLRKTELLLRTAIKTLSTRDSKDFTPLDHVQALKVLEILKKLLDVYLHYGLNPPPEQDISSELNNIYERTAAPLELPRKAQLALLIASISVFYQGQQLYTADRYTDAIQLHGQAQNPNTMQLVYNHTHSWLQAYRSNPKMAYLDKLNHIYVQHYSGNQQEALKEADALAAENEKTFATSYQDLIASYGRMFLLEENLGNHHRIMRSLERVEAILRSIDCGDYTKPYTPQTEILTERAQRHKEFLFHRSYFLQLAYTEELRRHLMNATEKPCD